MQFDRPIPVSVFIQVLNSQLAELRAKVFGEISQLKVWSSGHVYFDLKDPTDESVISCMIWKQNYRLMDIDLKEGMQIIATGKPQVYKRTGRLSFVAESIEYAGEGELKKAYDRLRSKLEAEGLFAESRKRPLPKYVKKIGVITSKQGAVIHDFENNLGQWGFKIKFVDSRVEGKEAIQDLLNAVYTMRNQDIEAMVIMRGGGSRASLAAFDSEALVRAIADFPVPVVAGIGHHEDVPLAVLAADISTSTPTAAAHEFNKSWEELVFKVKNLEDRIFHHFQHRLFAVIQSIEGYTENIFKSFEVRIRETLTLLTNIEKIIEANNPLRQLKLGYSLVRHNGKLVRSINEIKSGDNIETQVEDGTFKAKVE